MPHQDPQDMGSHEALAEGLKAESEQISQETWAFDIRASLPFWGASEHLRSEKAKKKKKDIPIWMKSSKE